MLDGLEGESRTTPARGDRDGVRSRRSSRTAREFAEEEDAEDARLGPRRDDPRTISPGGPVKTLLERRPSVVPVGGRAPAELFTAWWGRRSGDVRRPVAARISATIRLDYEGLFVSGLLPGERVLRLRELPAPSVSRADEATRPRRRRGGEMNARLGPQPRRASVGLFVGERRRRRARRRASAAPGRAPGRKVRRALAGRLRGVERLLRLRGPGGSLRPGCAALRPTSDFLRTPRESVPACLGLLVGDPYEAGFSG